MVSTTSAEATGEMDFAISIIEIALVVTARRKGLPPTPAA